MNDEWNTLWIEIEAAIKPMISENDNPEAIIATLEAQLRRLLIDDETITAIGRRLRQDGIHNILNEEWVRNNIGDIDNWPFNRVNF